MEIKIKAGVMYLDQYLYSTVVARQRPLYDIPSTFGYEFEPRM